MQKAGKIVRPGQRVRFLFTLGKPGVQAWDVPERPDPRTVDLSRYRTLFQRAVETVLAPIQQSVNVALSLDSRLGQAGTGVGFFKSPAAAYPLFPQQAQASPRQPVEWQSTLLCSAQAAPIASPEISAAQGR